jgi:hypothetical protein
MRALLLGFVLGCGSENGDAPHPDAGEEGGSRVDGGMVRVDAGTHHDTADADIEDAGDPVPPDTNVMFVTSKGYMPDFGGLAGADKICADVATAVGRKGKFVAWLSSSSTDAMSRLGNARGWVRADGLPFADTQDDLRAGHVFYPPQIDEYGEVTFDPYVRTATGTHADGTRSSDTCRDWSSQSQNDNTMVGSGSAGGHGWTELWIPDYPSSFPCSGPLHLYCFQIDHQTPVTVTPPKSTRLAFVSSTFIPVTGGLQAGDAACAKDAAAAKLPGTYKALMGTANLAPIDRFDVKGPPWSRVDGVDLHLSYLAAPLDLHADGTVYTKDVWVGAPDALGNVGMWSCDDWTSTDPNEFASTGTADWTYGYLFMGIACDSGPRPVFCLQE